MKPFKDTSDKVHGVLLCVAVEHGIDEFDLTHKSSRSDDLHVARHDGLYQFHETLTYAMVVMQLDKGSTILEKVEEGGAVEECLDGSIHVARVAKIDEAHYTSWWLHCR